MEDKKPSRVCVCEESNPICSCRGKPRRKISCLRKRDPAWVSCAPSPAEVRPSCVKTGEKYHIIEVSCPFCGRYHTHGGGEIDKPIYYGSRMAHCHNGSYTILPPL